MREKRVIFALVLMVVLFLDSPQFSHAKSLIASSLAANGNEQGMMSGIQMDRGNIWKDSYRITYYLNGGIPDMELPDSYIIEELPIRLAVPRKPGYNFAGWYTESNFRNKIYEITEDGIGDINLYAKWTKGIDANYSVEMYSYNTTSQVSGSDKVLKECDYGFIENVDIPGMPATREQDYINQMMPTASQCPQGMCITDDYILVTAYSPDDSEKLGALYVFDRDTGEYLVTIGMKKHSHLGGLTFDGRNLWICHSDSRSLERLSYQYIQLIAQSAPKMFVDATGMFEEYRVANMPSCITYHDGLLWVATHNVYFRSVMISYQYLDGELVEQQRVNIPSKVQGIAFDDIGDIYLSTSYGRDKSSYLRVYHGIRELDQSPWKPGHKVEMPPCSEEICWNDGTLYVLFESASEKYFEGTDGKGNSICPIDRILTIETDSLR